MRARIRFGSTSPAAVSSRLRRGFAPPPADHAILCAASPKLLPCESRQIAQQRRVVLLRSRSQGSTPGTDNNLAIRDDLNTAMVPQFFGGTGAAKIGEDAAAPFAAPRGEK